MRTLTALTRLVLATTLLSSASAIWTKTAFPNPETSKTTCRTFSGRICDPDSILNEKQLREVEDSLVKFEEHHSVVCGGDPVKIKTNQQDGTGVPLQFAVALVQQMDLSGFERTHEPEERAAQSFATHLHSAWGVGEASECGGTGLVLFLSMGDRVVYISKGTALVNVLTDSRLDGVIQDMRGFLRRGQYDKAILHAIHDIGQHLESGPPAFWERFMFLLEYLLPVGLFSIVFSIAAYSERRNQQARREYARVQTQLSELDRSRAEALQGRYQCTSCPICLNDFSTTSTEEASTAPSSSSNSSSSSSSTQGRLGSDGLPLKLLRCGHAFDETCFNEWIESGQGNLRQCPICNQDVGSSVSASAADSTVSPTYNEEGGEALLDAEPDEGGTLRQRAPREEQMMDRVARQFARERAFRLARLHVRYPQYVRNDQLQRWNQPSYDGSLARDPGFVRNKPADPQRSSSGGSRSGRSFGGGGGGSGGGRGGRW